MKENIFNSGPTPTYQDMIAIRLQEVDEEMVSLQQHNVGVSIFDKYLAPSTGEDIFVRAGVAQKLQEAQTFLDQEAKGYKLEVTYGYRHPDIQLKAFIEQLVRFSKDGDVVDLGIIEKAHEYIACPIVAGHPCGAAVDLWILNNSGEVLDFGTEMHDLSPESKITNKELTNEQLNNRFLLRRVMMQAGFAPYNGEWWHFSYKDREHTSFYSKERAAYAPVSFDHVSMRLERWRSPTEQELINMAQVRS